MLAHHATKCCLKFVLSSEKTMPRWRWHSGSNNFWKAVCQKLTEINHDFRLKHYENWGTTPLLAPPPPPSPHPYVDKRGFLFLYAITQERISDDLQVICETILCARLSENGWIEAIWMRITHQLHNYFWVIPVKRKLPLRMVTLGLDHFFMLHFVWSSRSEMTASGIKPYKN